MYTPATTSQFKKDIKKSKKRGKDMTKIMDIMQRLTRGEALEDKYRDHALIGNYAERRECHIEPDWLLIYKIDLQEKMIIFENTGTHSDLFK